MAMFKKVYDQKWVAKISGQAADFLDVENSTPYSQRSVKKNFRQWWEQTFKENKMPLGEVTNLEINAFSMKKQSITFLLRLDAP